MILPTIVAVLLVCALVFCVYLMVKEEIKSVHFWREIKKRNKDIERVQNKVKG